MRKLCIILALTTTLLVSLWPDFHPEREINIAYSLPLDMLFHSGYYFFLCILLRYIKFIPIKTVFFVLLLFSISILLEIAQAWVPKRYLSPSDIISNALGITLGALFYQVVWGKFKKSKIIRGKINENQKR